MKKVLVILYIFLLFSNNSAQETHEMTTYFHKCKYIKSETAKKVLENFMSPLGRVSHIDYLNAVLVYDTKEQIENIKSHISQMDVYVPQVFVDARIIEITIDADSEYEITHGFTSSSDASVVRSGTGLSLGVPGANPATGQGLNILLQPLQTDLGRLNEYIRFLVTSGKAKILSSPNLVVDYGTEGSIITGEQIPVLASQIVGGAISTTTQFKSIGIKLKVVPQQITEDSVRLSVNPEVSTVTGYTTGAGGVASPIIAVRSTDTILTVKDGEIISIGGLMRSEERKIEKKVPILGDIPLLGMLFRSERNQSVKTQLMFFLKISILKEGEKEGKRIFEPGIDEKTINEQINKIEKK